MDVGFFVSIPVPSTSMHLRMPDSNSIEARAIMPFHERLVAWSLIDHTKVRTHQHQIPQRKLFVKRTLEMPLVEFESNKICTCNERLVRTSMDISYRNLGI